MNNESPVISDEVFVPATESQLEVWVSCLLGGDDANRAFNLSVTVNFSGALKQTLLEQSLQQLINRHESLRAVFSSDASQVCIKKQQALDLYFEDLSSKNEIQKQVFIDDFSRSDVNTVFDLLNGPLYKLSLFKLSGNEHILIFTAHHIICDGWSMGLFLEELGKIYSALVKGEPNELEEANSFIQYALDQEKFLQSDEYKQIEQFWINQYKDSVPVLDLPTDFPRPAVRTNKSNRYDITLEKNLFSDITAMGIKERSSLAITLRAVFEILLYKLSGQDDIVLGLPTAGQAVTGQYNLIAHCINLLPIRCKFKSGMTFKDYLNERKFATLDAYENQQFTFGELIKKLNIPRDPSRVPLVSAVFSLDMGMGELIKMGDLNCEVKANKRDYENFDIFINATNSNENFQVECTYNTQLFKPESIKAIMDDYESLLYTIVKDPDLLLDDILYSNQNEILAKVAKWNNTKTTYPENKPVHQFVSENAAAYPDKIALSFKDKSLSYKILNERANQLAHFLIKSEVQPGDSIALAIDRSEELLISLLAIMKTGAFYIPVDPEYPIKRIEYMLSDSATRVLISSEKYKDKFAKEGIKEIILEDIKDELTQHPPTDPVVEVRGTDLAYVIYTSGSTGNPKGIAIEHHSLTNFLCSIQKEPGISPDDKLLAVTTISFDISGLELYLPLISGAELILADAEIVKDARELVDLVKSKKVSIMQATPSTWRMMTESNWEERIDLKVLCGGEPLSKDLAEALLNRCSSLWNMYGPTETTIWSAVKQITNSSDPISIGHPIDNTQIYILDENQRLLPAGRTGEIYIGGDGLARTYLNKPELTSKSFISNPISPELSSRIYRSGDLGKFMKNGDLQCFGRIDNQVKVRGYRIELGAIQEVLNEQVLVKESLVIAKEYRPGDQRLLAYIIPDTDEQLPANQIMVWKQGLKESLPPYMIPGDFITLEKFPLLPNGKIDRKSLPKSNETVREIKKEYPPVTEFQKLIASVWEEILDKDSVQLNDDFFDLGGHSLLAVQVMVQLEEKTGISLPITTLFKVSGLEEFVEQYEIAKKKLSLSSSKIQSDQIEENSKDLNRQEIDFVAPRTDIEDLVAKIWAEHLGLDEVSVYDDFFELGGHSLMAIRVLNQLEKETGKRLPLTTLFEHNTIETMAHMLEMDAKSITWDSLVAIKPQGHKIPLYIVHGAGLNVLFFNTLAKNMDSEQPVYGLQAKGLNGVDEPLEKIEDMAAYYISEILKQNPKGPYAVAGFSFGGIIAFEMAKQFKAMSKEVRMLAMFDTFAYQSDRYDPFFKKIFNRIRYFFKQLIYTFTLFKEDPSRTIEYKSQSIKRRLIKLYWKIRYGSDQQQEGFFGYANNIDIKNSEAWEKYVFTPYNGSIELFRAKKRTFYMDDFEYLGWKPYALKGINIHEIPGEHNYIFAPPNDKEFAAILQQCLDNAAIKKGKI